MLDLLLLVVAFPFAGFLILATLGRRLPRWLASTVGVGSIGLSAAAALAVGLSFMVNPPATHAFTQTLWTWFDIGGLDPAIAFRLDALSCLMMLVVTVVGFLIHAYSSEFMAHDEDFSRFFAYMNLFVGAMLTLVLGENLLLLYLGWEGVGLCSYFLIGFWYKDAANGSAARKAFIVTRIGDTAMAIGLFILVYHFNTLSIQEILVRAETEWILGSGIAVATAALLLGGALGKSAQLPLQTWLPDAMAGPTPVSALIHAATMVTAGVYLIARTNALFALAPVVQTIVAVIGAATLLIAGFTALTQRDIKRVLAYSTISQIGYMFLALGVGAYTAAMFHFMTHAFFKALLFLAAGVLIECLHHEHDMFKMGGMRKHFPTTYWTFLVGAASLAAVPLITSGFYSKDAILWFAWSSDLGSPVLWAAGVAGAFVTALYSFRMVFVTFFGDTKTQPDRKPGSRMKLPLVALAVLAIVGGFVEMPHTLGHFAPLSGFLHSILPAVPMEHVSVSTELLFQIIAVIVSLTGIYLAYWFYLKKPEVGRQAAASGIPAVTHRFWFSGWGFDWVYNRLFVWPYYWIARVNRDDIIDFLYTLLSSIVQGVHFLVRTTQNGRVRTYAAGITFGAVVLVAIVVFA